MSITTIGRVVADATIENQIDLFEVRNGTRRIDDVRRIHVREVDIATGPVRIPLYQ